MEFGILSLLPPVLSIVLAFVSKNVIISLFFGVFSGTLLLGMASQSGALSTLSFAFTHLTETFLSNMANPWNSGIILQCLTIGGFIAIVGRMGGTLAVAEALSRKAKSGKSAQLITWLLGLFIFFDDYANSLIIGPIMRPVSDKMKISREKLSFITDSTAAPIAGLALISTWVGYEVGLIRDGFASVGIAENAYSAFVSTIPFRFYNIFILAFIVVSALTLREFGPMLKAERRAYFKNEPLRIGSMPMADDNDDSLSPKADTPLRKINALLPILVLIVGSFVGFYVNGFSGAMASESISPDLLNAMTAEPFSFASIREAFGYADASIVIFQAALFASMVAIAMGLCQKIFKLDEAINTFMSGVKSLILTGVILILAWSLSSIVKELGTAQYLSQALVGKIPMFLLPSLIFILGSVISFSTGTSYGTMGILMPLSIPLAFQMSGGSYDFVLVSVSAVLTGAIFGDHCSPISDTTILSSMGAGCDLLDHVGTQMWYALSVAFISIVFGFIPAGLMLPVYIILPLGILAVVALLFLVGKPVVPKDEAQIAEIERAIELEEAA
ncbi:MAG: Na+/H+ antiporter NhaC family protein [Proteocatella sp.]